MRINAAILYDNLKAKVALEMSCSLSNELVLERPRFNFGEEKVFLSNQLYISLADRLHNHPKLQKDTVIICIGDSHLVPYYREHCCLMQIRENLSPFYISNLVHEIYNKYDAWNTKMLEILSSSASISEILEVSHEIIANPLFVIDSDFHIVANAGYSDIVVPQATDMADSENLDISRLAQFLEHSEPSMHIKEPILLEMFGTITLNINLFHHDIYLGCLTIDYRQREHCDSDIPIATHLAKIIVIALRKLSSTVKDKQSILKHALLSILDGMQPTSEQQITLSNLKSWKNYICIKMIFGRRMAKLPLNYICDEFARVITESITFVYDSSVVVFINIDEINLDNDKYTAKLRKSISEFIRPMDIRVGISDLSDDLFKARLFYKQSCIALDLGTLIHPDKQYFVFQDFALSELLINAIGDLPIEMYFTSGLRKLSKHDEGSHISYIETLCAYLNNNMSVSKTAAALFIHRSTLVERIARIERELLLDLSDPDERLRIQLLLRAIQVYDQIRDVPRK